jgi:hypothetical protein
MLAAADSPDPLERRGVSRYVNGSVISSGANPGFLIRDRSRWNDAGPASWKVDSGPPQTPLHAVGAALSYLVIATRAGRNYAVALSLWAWVPPSSRVLQYGNSCHGQRE